MRDLEDKAKLSVVTCVPGGLTSPRVAALMAALAAAGVAPEDVLAVLHDTSAVAVAAVMDGEVDLPAGPGVMRCALLLVVDVGAGSASASVVRAARYTDHAGVANLYVEAVATASTQSGGTLAALRDHLARAYLEDDEVRRWCGRSDPRRLLGPQALDAASRMLDLLCAEPLPQLRVEVATPPSSAMPPPPLDLAALYPGIAGVAGVADIADIADIPGIAGARGPLQRFEDAVAGLVLPLEHLVRDVVCAAADRLEHHALQRLARPVVLQETLVAGGGARLPLMRRAVERALLALRLPGDAAQGSPTKHLCSSSSSSSSRAARGCALFAASMVGDRRGAAGGYVSICVKDVLGLDTVARAVSPASERQTPNTWADQIHGQVEREQQQQQQQQQLRAHVEQTPERSALAGKFLCRRGSATVINPAPLSFVALEVEVLQGGGPARRPMRRVATLDVRLRRTEREELVTHAGGVDLELEVDATGRVYAKLAGQHPGLEGTFSLGGAPRPRAGRDAP